MTEQESYRHVPYDIEVEQSCLGSLIRDNRLIDVAAAELEYYHFYDPLHQRMFEMIVHLSKDGAVDPLILHSAMKADPGLQEVGGPAYPAGLAGAAPAIPNILDLARILKELAARRALIKISEDTANAAYEQRHDLSAQMIADEATESLLRIGRTTARPMLSAYDIAMESLKEAEAISTGKPVPVVSTGFSQVNEEIGGFRGGDLIVVAGKSGMGKSALLGCIARHAALLQVPTIVFSLEMTQRQWIERMICDMDFDTAIQPMWYSRIRNGRMTTVEFNRFAEAMQKLHGLPFQIQDDDSLTMQQIMASARAFKAKHDNRLGIVLIDYLQIINPGDTRDRNREQVVASFARGAKSLAKRLGWPVVAGSQVNENDIQRTKDEKRPQLGDTRESKAIGIEADLVLAPYRESYYVENRKPANASEGDPAWTSWKAELSGCQNRMEMLCLKNRHGRRFDASLYCDMGASAIRDQEPYRPTAADRAADELALDR